MGEAGREAETAPRRRRLRPEERLPQILEAALEEFAEHGFGGASMAGAAARAGIAKGLIYHYFPGKAELFAAVVRSCVQPTFTQAEALVAAHRGSWAVLLRQLVEFGFARVAAEEREGLMFKLLLAEADRFPELRAFYRAEVLDRALALTRDVIRRGEAAGEFRAGASEEAGLPAVLMAPIAMASVWRGMLGAAEAPSPEAMGRALAALALDGLGRRGP